MLKAGVGRASANGLYVHVPFCTRKCEYCAFFSEPATPSDHAQFATALIREFDQLPANLGPNTIFFGGGTPTLLSTGLWEQILSAMDRRGLLQRVQEWTVECNPATCSTDKARLLREYGVNRVSLGVQSLHDPLLRRLGRVHTRQMVFDSYDTLRRAGFEQINIDLMFAIPGQSLSLWQSTLNEVIAMSCDHLSTYEVTYEEDTPLFNQLHAGLVAEDEDLACAMYDDMIARSAKAGFVQYEVSNFARKDPASQHEIPPTACRHNINYWRGGSFHGLGPSACSYHGGVRTRNVANTHLYCELIQAGKTPIESRDELPPLARAGEIAAFGLRMNMGWPFKEFRATTGYDLIEHWKPALTSLVDRGWAEWLTDSFRLTHQGLRFADTVAEEFLVTDDTPSPAPEK